MIPLQALGTGMALTLGFYYMPKSPASKDEVLQSYLQEFAWTRAALPARKAARNAHMAGSARLAREPMFCMETAVKLLYFSNLVYSAEGDAGMGTAQGEASPEGLAKLAEESVAGAAAAAVGAEADLEAGAVGPEAAAGLGDVETALRLCGLQRWEVVEEAQTDTRALLAWSEGTLVLAFKGTSSFENVKTDLNVSSCMRAALGSLGVPSFLLALRCCLSSHPPHRRPPPVCSQFMKVPHPPTRTAPVTSVWGLSLLRSLVSVHKGFYAAWSGCGYEGRVVERVRAALAGMGPRPRVLVTGHSLGKK
jgi:hypothetical protein